MSASARDAFLRESDEYLRRLEEILGDDGAGELDPQEVYRVCRALRGAAQMAREEHVFTGARIFENAARQLSETREPWDERVRENARSTVADLWRLIETGQADESHAAAIDLVAGIRTRWEELGVEENDGLAYLGADPAADDGADDGSVTVPGVDLPPDLLEYLDRELSALLAGLAEARARLSEEEGLPPLGHLAGAPRAILGSAGVESLPRLRDALVVLERLSVSGTTRGEAAASWQRALRAAESTMVAFRAALSVGRLPGEEADTALEELKEAAAGLAPAGPGEEEKEDLPPEVARFFRAEAEAARGRLVRLAAPESGGGGAAGAEADAVRRGAAGQLTVLRDLARAFGLAGAAEHLEGALDELRSAPDETVRERVERIARGLDDAAAAPVADRDEHSDDRPVVPIQTLEYGGRAALARALELRKALEEALAAGRDATPLLEELFDLIRLGMR